MKSPLEVLLEIFKEKLNCGSEDELISEITCNCSSVTKEEAINLVNVAKSNLINKSQHDIQSNKSRSQEDLG